MPLRSQLRALARALVRRLPGLRRFSGLGLGRLLSGRDGEEVISLGDGIRLEVDLRLSSCRALYFVCDPATAAETVICQRLLGPEDTLVDVGANFGYFALLAARRAGRVLAFEASPYTFAHLQRNLALNPRQAERITPFPLGLAAAAGQAEFFRPANDPGVASLRPAGGQDTPNEIVQLDTLDHAIGALPVALIKLDVEGAELDVLHGAAGTLARCQPLVLTELFEPNQRRFNRTCADIVSFLEVRGYVGRWIRQDPATLRVELPPLDLAALTASGSIENALFIPAARLEPVLRAARG